MSTTLNVQGAARGAAAAAAGMRNSSHPSWIVCTAGVEQALRMIGTDDVQGDST
jgi:hypothetical protein